METPLVSIAVITYNSSRYVLGALESIKSQTYSNLELIISDDGSKDDTVRICREWIENNESFFYRTELITVPSNTGTSANYNRAEKACKGSWVLTIDGDDLLFDNAVSSYLEYIDEHPDAAFIFARIKAFGASPEKCQYFEDVVFDMSFFDLSPQEQYFRLVLKGNCIPSGTFFYNRKVRNDLGVINDERIPLLEDWPKWINLLKAGARFNFLNNVTLKYRLREGSLSTSSISDGYRKSLALFYIYYQFKLSYKKKQKKDELVSLILAHRCSGKTNLYWDFLFIIYFLIKKVENKQIIHLFYNG